MELSEGYVTKDKFKIRVGRLGRVGRWEENLLVELLCLVTKSWHPNEFVNERTTKRKHIKETSLSTSW